MKKLILKSLALVLCLTLLAGCGAPAAPSNSGTTPDKTEKKLRIAMLPQFKGENYFDGCKEGALAAAKELGIEIFYDGPNQSEATNAKQVEILNGFIANGVDAIIISPCDSEGIAPTLIDAMNKGIKVVTFDCDARIDARHIMVNPSTANDIALGLMTAITGELSKKGFGKGTPARLALISGSGVDESTNSWCVAIRDLTQTDEFGWVKLDCDETGYKGGDIWTPGSDEAAAQNAGAQAVAKSGGAKDGSQINAILGMSTMAAPAIAAAWNNISGEKPDVVMAGVATPLGLIDYIKDENNPLTHGVLWSVYDLGYLSVEAANALCNGSFDPVTAKTFPSKLETKDVVTGESGGREILLGPALIFDKENVDDFNF